MASFFTIGHSTRCLDEFISLLEHTGVKTVADVRTIPRSRTNPQFNTDALPHALASSGIDYAHLAKLGGFRGRQKDKAVSPNMFWDNKSFRNYADYAGTEPFRTGLRELQDLGHDRNAAIMCAEAVWWRCHRRIIADYLITQGEVVFHILGPNKIEPAHITPAAQISPDGTLVYPAANT
ncbi:MAG TPA: DUF488 domain-containing protein [Micropepsaceae bacterium]|nr:DUF488 domain-containing protein [Micropepsaceae bacterium]